MTYDEKKIRATELRRSKNYVEALALYKELYNEVNDKFNVCGLLHCLRKTDNLEEALTLVDEIKAKYLDFDWFKNEVVWILIQGKLLKLSEEESITKVVEQAKQIMELEPDDFAKSTIVFRVLKIAKKNREWKIISEWSSKLEVNSIDDKPMIDEKGREGWSKKSLWYNYRINALIKEDRYEEAEILIEQSIMLFPKFKKFFLRLRGIIKTKQGNFDAAIECYKELVSVRNADWWLLHEYGRILKYSGKLEEALKYFHFAAIKSYRLESSVKLFYDIAEICIELNINQEAIAHLYLAKLLREEKGWSIPNEINSSLTMLSTKSLDTNYPNVKSAMIVCKKYWDSSVNKDEFQTSDDKIIGILLIPQKEGSYAFIKTEKFGEIFCLKKDLPKVYKNGDKLVFEKVKSLNKKKNVESWKAINIKKIE